MAEKTNANIGFEKEIWDAACVLWGHIPAAEYRNDQLVAMTKELTELLRKNKTIDWQKREGARSHMKMLVKRLLKKYKYPPEGEEREKAIQTMLVQCELWTDNFM